VNTIKARMLNRRASSATSKSDEIIKALSLKPSQQIADVGSEGGYFSFLFAGYVGMEGKVYAIDTNKGLLDFVRSSSEKNGFHNIITVLAEDDRFSLMNVKLDLIFLRNIYHHLHSREVYFRNLAEFLDNGARIAIIDYDDRSKLSFHRLFCHCVPKATIIKEMTTAGYRLIEDHTFLPEQSFLVFLTNEKNHNQKEVLF
jgi:ubiquinone/menaquinone biosynthesis C-methylase UbiE